ncbi:MAG: hypothetical protein JF586_12820 [Burkholderiales bacterium]|nr:hypothetical protein [Burkholderiales bacterium]
MTPRAIKFSALAGLALAIALIALSLVSGMQSSAINGPQALGVTPRGEVWIGVDKALWRVSAEGRWLQETSAADLGLPGPPSNLVREPDGHLVATVRDDPRLFVLDAATAHVTRTITPRWPEDLRNKGKDAINVAFAPDGRIAIATGGGHAVVLFDAQGRFLARTAPGIYRFTNGLWWAGDVLWTTDTNRSTLRRLDGRTLAVLQAIDLSSVDDARYLGPAKAIGPADPTAAMIRFRNGMIVGRVVIVHPDGSETALAGPRDFEPTDVDWNGRTVLATDGAAMAVHRWSVDGEALSDLGDDEFASRMRQLTATRAGLWKRHTLALRTAIPVFIVAFLLALVSKRREDAAAPAAARLDLARLGTPQPGTAAMLGLGLRILWPLPALLAASQLPRWAPGRHWLATAMPQGTAARLAVVAGLVVAWALLAVAVARGLRRKGRLAEFEPVINGTALRRLRAAGADQLPLAEGEHVIETFMLIRQPADRPGARRFGGLGFAPAAMRWVVCTSRGVRLFRVSGRSQQLEDEFALADVAGVSTQPPSRRATGWSPAWLALRTGRGGWLAITLRDGRTIEGTVTSPVTLARVAAFLASAHPAQPSTPRPAMVPTATATAGPDRAVAALASALLPGLGQWWQRRGGMALLFFLPWAVLLLARAIPVAWTVLGTRADVSTQHVALVFGIQAAYAVLAAWDAWQMGRRRQPATA